MKVRLSYLMDCVAAFAPRWNAAGEGDPAVAAVCRWLGGDEVLRPNTLYLCMDGCPARGTQIPAGTWFVTRAGEGEYLTPRVALDCPPTQNELYALLMDAAESYSAWLEELVRLALAEAGVQKFLDASEAMLKNAVLVQNSAYSLIAISSSATPEDYPFFDFGGTRTPVPEFLFSMQREYKIEQEFSADGNRFVVGNQDGRREIHCSMIHQGEVCVRVTCAVTRTELTVGLLGLFVEFCRYLRYAINIALLFPQPGGNSNYALEQLTRFGRDEAMRSLLGAREEWSFMAAVLDTPGHMVPGYLAQIQEMIPNSAAFLHDGAAAVVFCVSDKEGDAVFRDYQFQRVGALADALDGRFGLSYLLTDLTDLFSGLEQGARALELAGAGERLCFYENQAVRDMLERFFADRALMAWLPPEMAALCRADRENGQKNCQVLYHYLLSGRSLDATAQAMHMHRSTVVYRLDRMKKRFGLRLDEAERNQLYLLCCRAAMDRSGER